MAAISWTYPSEVESEGRMLDDLATFLEENENDTEINQVVMLAVSESFTNALIHGNGREPLKKIRVSINVNDSSVTADIFDEGTGGLERIANRSEAEALAENGRGIALIEHYASKTVFSTLETGGLHVSLIFCKANKMLDLNNVNENGKDGGDDGTINERSRECRHTESERSA